MVFFLKKLRISVRPFCGATDTLFWNSGDICLGFKVRVDLFACMLHYLHAMDFSDSPLVQHLLTCWWTGYCRGILIHVLAHIKTLVGLEPGIDHAVASVWQGWWVSLQLKCSHKCVNSFYRKDQIVLVAVS